MSSVPDDPSSSDKRFALPPGLDILGVAKCQGSSLEAARRALTSDGLSFSCWRGLLGESSRGRLCYRLHDPDRKEISRLTDVCRCLRVEGAVVSAQSDHGARWEPAGSCFCVNRVTAERLRGGTGYVMVCVRWPCTMQCSAICGVMKRWGLSVLGSPEVQRVGYVCTRGGA